jgi:hypothetical protein
LKDDASDVCKIELIIPDRIIGSGWVSEIKEFAFNEKKYLQ